MLSMVEPVLDIDATNRVLETYDPPHAVAWAARQFGNELVMSSSFGAESALLIHMATQVLPRIRIIFVDTGYLFPETHRFMEDLRRRQREGEGVRFVTMCSEHPDVVGHPGVDVTGPEYDWKKRRR